MVNFYTRQSQRLILFSFFIISTISLLVGQTPQFYNNNAGNSSNGFPLNSATSNKAQWIYGPGVFSSTGGGAGTPSFSGNITKVYFKLGTTVSAASVYSNFTISLGQNVGTAVTIPSTTFNTGLTQCYFLASGFPLTGTIAANTWVGVTLQTPFTYDPNLSLVCELKVSGGTGNAVYQTTTGGNQRLYAGYAAATGTSGTGLVNFGFDEVLNTPCITPPTPGTVTCLSGTIVCPNTNFLLTLGGGTAGIGQTYQWQSSPNNSTWTNISGATLSSYTGSQTTSTYYRCEVTCGGNTVASSGLQMLTTAVPLSGTYTINNFASTSGTNFQTFTELADVLACSGVSGPVIVNVDSAAGPYFEQVNFRQAPGVSATNTITINGNGAILTTAAGATVTPVATAADPHTLMLNGADYMTFNNLTVNATGATYGLACHLWNQANNNTFNNCLFVAPTTGTGTTLSPFSLSGTQTSATGAGSGGNNNLVNNCTTIGGYYAVSFAGGAGALGVGNTLQNCNLLDFYLYGVYNIYQNGAIISKNTIERPTRTTVSTFYGAFATTGCTGMLIEKNKVRNPYAASLTSTTAAYGIYVSADGKLNNPNQIINNLVYDMKSNGTIAGLYLIGADTINAYHNTISLDDPNATAGLTYGIYSTGTIGGIDIRNNVVSITRGGTGLKYGLYYTAGLQQSETNDIYVNATTGGNFGYYLTAAQLDLATWQATSGKDGTSYSVDPVYNTPSVGNYAPTEVNLNNTGSALGISTDITNAPRSMTTPDIGAYEFTVVNTDAGSLALVAPAVGNNCYSANETVTIQIKNYGIATLNFAVNPLTVVCNVTGATTASMAGTVNTGTLATGQTLNVTMNGTLNMSAIGTYTFNSSCFLTGDQNPTNDAMTAASRTKLALTAGTIIPSQSSLCLSGTPTITLSGSAGGNVQWQESTTGVTGPWTNVGTNALSYAPGSVTQTTYYQAELSCYGAPSYSNVDTVTVNNPQLLGTTPASICGIGSLTLGASVAPGNTANWYTAATGGAPVATGTSYTTPVISSTTNYYVTASSGGFSANVCKTAIDPGAATGGGLTTYMVFDAITNMNIVSVDLFPYGATDGVPGTVTIELRNAAGTPIMSQIVNVIAHNSTALSVPQTVFLNFPVTPGTGYRLGVNAWTGGVTNLYRDYLASGYPYPYTIPGTMSITGNSLSNTYVYFFYNWLISTGCETPRQMVTATINPGPALTVTNGATICSNEIKTLNVTSTIPDFDAYTWSPTTGLYTDASATVPYTGTALTTGTVYVKSTTAGNTVYTCTGTNATTQCTNLDTVNIYVQPTSVVVKADSICISGVTALLLTGTNTGIQWQENIASVWTNIAGANGTTYVTPSLSTTTDYRARIMNSLGVDCILAPVSAVVNNPTVTSTTGATRCGVGTVDLQAVAGSGTLTWYDVATGGLPLGTGATFTTPSISTTTNYYVAAETPGGKQAGGRISVSTAGGALGTTAVPRGIVLNMTSASQIDSIGFMSTGVAATLTLRLYNTGGTAQIGTDYTVSIPANTGTATVPKLMTVPVAIPINAIGTYRLFVTGMVATGSPLYYEYTGVTGYPYNIGTVGQVTASVTSLTAAVSTTTYYYMYKIVAKAACASPRQW